MRLSSDHFTDDHWADHARGLTSAELRQSMLEHLEQRCPACLKANALWSFVSKAVAADDRYEPPASAVRIAKAMFSIQAPEGLVARTVRMATLLFDSQLMPSPAGVRSGGSSARRCMYANGDTRIDLQIEPATQRGPALLIGQVLSSHPGQSAAGSSVRLELQDRVLATTTTSSSGEFHIEFDIPLSGLSLVFGLFSGETAIHLGDLVRTQS